MAIFRDIEDFAPIDGNWQRLDDLLCELWMADVRQGQLEILFKVFERFPEDDGAGVLWGIVHGVESLPFEYEAELRESIARRPSLMGRIMLQRLENSRPGCQVSGADV